MFFTDVPAPRTSMIVWFLAAASLVLGPAAAEAGPADESEPTPGTLAIEVGKGSDAAPWVAAALEAHLARELSTYERLSVRHPDAAVHQACGQDRGCRLARYRETGVDVLFVMSVRADAIRYELYETWTPSEVDRGAIALGDISTLIGLRQRLLAVFTPVLAPGGLLDQKPFRTSGRALSGVPAVRPDRIAALLAAVALFLAVPWGFAFMVLSDRRRLWSQRWPSLWAATGALAVAAALMLGAGDRLTVGPSAWVLGLVGGAAWGTFFVTNVRFLAPPLPGLGRVEHRDVFRLVVAWLVVGGTRFIGLTLYYLPFAWVTFEMDEGLGLSSEAAMILLAPSVGLMARGWLSSWMHVAALVLDEWLVIGEAGPDNPWHREVSRYFTGYLRRTGWALDPEILDSLLFLPGEREGVRCYGGGGIPARVVIDERLLILAIGARDDRDEDGEAVAVPDWTAGLVIAQSSPPPAARPRPRRQPRLRGRAPLVRREPLTSETGHQRKHLGQAATLLGYVRPEPEEHVPLIADTVEDLEVVRALLAEHYQWFAPDPDEDHDDTDPTDKDFLFGPLTHAVGRLIRQDSRLGIFALLAAERAHRSMTVVRWLHRQMTALVTGLVGRSAVVIADAYPALHFAGHHHLQYLVYRGTGREDHLTVRASLDELERTSRRALGRVGREMVEADPPTRPVFVRRLVWLSSFLAEPLVDRGERRLRWAATTLMVLVALGGLGGSVYRAVRYHPVYIERMAEQERRRQRVDHQEAQENEGAASHVGKRNASE